MLARVLTATLLLLAGSAAANAAPLPGPSPAPVGVWLAVSDIHLDPFDRSTQVSDVGSDSNVTLFDAAIAQMKRAVPNPSLVLLPGDFFVHDFPQYAAGDSSATSTSLQNAGITTMQSIATAFDRAFPRAQFAIVPGNNDSWCGDYKSDAGSRYLVAVAHVWAPLVNRHGAAPQFATSFARNGYYTAALPVRGLRLVAIDTVLLSDVYGGSCDGAPGSAARELNWLATTLRATPGVTRNLVLMHIPPGFDAVTTQALLGSGAGVRMYPGIIDDVRAKFKRLATAAAPWPFLGPRNNARLIDALTAPENRVAFAIAGHAHRFDFRLAGNVPIFVLGALSPVYHNNPSFYALHVDGKGALHDVDFYAFDEATQAWVAPWSFDRTWSVTKMDAAELEGLHARLGADPALRLAWDAQSNGRPSEYFWRSWVGFWKVPWCAQTRLAGGFAQCAGIEGRIVLVRAVLAAGVLLIAAVPVAAVLLIFRKVRRLVR